MWSKIMNWIHDLTAGTGYVNPTKVRTSEQSQKDDRSIDAATSGEERAAFDQQKASESFEENRLAE